MKRFSLKSHQKKRQMSSKWVDKRENSCALSLLDRVYISVFMLLARVLVKTL